MSAAGIFCIDAAAAIPQEMPRVETEVNSVVIPQDPGEPLPELAPPSDPGLWLYRNRTVAMLRRYARLSVEVGRLPSLLGRELFQAKVTAYRAATFEDVIIFVHDVEQSLEKLDGFEQELVAKIVFQFYSQDEAAQILGCWRRTVGRRFLEAVDRLSEIFLIGGLLVRLPERKNGTERILSRG